MTNQNIQLLIDVSTMYYNENMTQDQISKRFGLSRPKVSRLLSEARKKGIVKIFISNVLDDISYMERKFLSTFNLHEVCIVSVPADDSQLALQLTAKEAAKLFSANLQNGDRIGVGWGVTLKEVSRYLPAMSLSESVIAQLCGNLDNADSLNFANDILTNFAARLGIKDIRSLPCPIVVDNQIIRDILLHDEKTRNNIEFVSSCNKMIVNINAATENHCLYKCNYINDDDILILNSKDATGSVCCRFYDINTELCHSQLDSRTLSVSLEDIKDAESVFACVVGTDKAYALYSLLKARYIDVLAVDSITAAKVLEIYNLDINYDGEEKKNN